MFFYKKRHKTATCPAKVLVDILNANLANGLSTSVTFLLDGRKHSFGACGDAGETRKNVCFYLDDYECYDKQEFLQNACVGGALMLKSEASVTVTECDGCYPDSTPCLVPYLDK